MNAEHNVIESGKIMYCRAELGILGSKLRERLRKGVVGGKTLIKLGGEHRIICATSMVQKVKKVISIGLADESHEKYPGHELQLVTHVFSSLGRQMNICRRICNFDFVILRAQVFSVAVQMIRTALEKYHLCLVPVKTDGFRNSQICVQ